MQSACNLENAKSYHTLRLTISTRYHPCLALQGVQRPTHFFGTGGSAVEDTTHETIESKARSPFKSDVAVASVTSLFDTQDPCFASLGLVNLPHFVGERLERVLSDGSRIGASEEDGNTDAVGSGAEKIEDFGHPQTIAVTDVDLDDLLGRAMEPRLPMLSTTKKRKKDVSRATGRTSSVDKVQARYCLFVYPLTISIRVHAFISVLCKLKKIVLIAFSETGHVASP